MNRAASCLRVSLQAGGGGLRPDSSMSGRYVTFSGKLEIGQLWQLIVIECKP